MVSARIRWWDIRAWRNVGSFAQPSSWLTEDWTCRGWYPGRSECPGGPKQSRRLWLRQSRKFWGTKVTDCLAILYPVRFRKAGMVRNSCINFIIIDSPYKSNIILFWSKHWEIYSKFATEHVNTCNYVYWTSLTLPLATNVNMFMQCLWDKLLPCLD